MPPPPRRLSVWKPRIRRWAPTVLWYLLLFAFIIYLYNIIRRRMYRACMTIRPNRWKWPIRDAKPWFSWPDCDD